MCRREHGHAARVARPLRDHQAACRDSDGGRADVRSAAVVPQLRPRRRGFTAARPPRVVAPLKRLRGLRTIPRVQWLRVGFVMCSQLALFVYLAKGTLLNGMLLYNTGPLFTPPLAWLLWRTTIRPTGIASIVLGFVGVTLVIDPTRSTLDGMTLLGLASGFFNSCSQLSLYAGGKDGLALSETDNLFQFFTLCAAACLVVLLFRPAELTIGAQRLGESALLASFVALKSLSSHFWLPRTAVVCLRPERNSG
jgi:drug/metabolite transporter (DMT)-like permease